MFSETEHLGTHKINILLNCTTYNLNNSSVRRVFNEDWPCHISGGYRLASHREDLGSVPGDFK